MQYRRLGDAGVKLSEIGLGGWLTFGNAVEQERARNIFAAAFDASEPAIDISEQGLGRVRYRVSRGRAGACAMSSIR